MILLGLFFSAFIAATLIPAQSEAVLLYALYETQFAAWIILGVATVGNVLGAFVNWILGRLSLRFVDHPRCPFSPQQVARAQRHYERFGWLSLTLSWAPVIGDPITFVAGILKEPLWRFLLIVTVAKGGRYLVLAWLLGLMSNSV